MRPKVNTELDKTNRKKEPEKTQELETHTVAHSRIP